MSSVKQKYLKGTNGDIISPIVSTGSVYLNTGESIGEVISSDHLEEQVYKGRVECTTNGNNKNPTDEIISQSGMVNVTVGGKLIFPEGYYEVTVISRYTDTTAGSDCSEALGVYNSSGSQVSKINVWERNFKRVTGYLDCVVYVPQNGYIQVNNYDDSNTNDKHNVYVMVKKV